MSYKHNVMRDLRITWFFEVLVFLLVIRSVEPGLSQVVPNQSADQNFRAQQLVSKNQPLTPEKALRAIDRAREDMLRGIGARGDPASS